MKIISSIEELLSLKQFYIYCAGNISRKIIQCLKNNNKESSILKIFVSKLSNKKIILGHKIFQFELESIDKNIPVLIASIVHKSSVVDYLVSCGIDNIITLSNDFEEYLNLSNFDFNATICNNICNSIISEVKSNKIASPYDITFISPPYWDMYAPFSAVPCLKAYLERENFRTYQIDWGIICFRYAALSYGPIVVEDLLSKEFFFSKVKNFKKNIYKTYLEYYEDMSFLYEKDLDIDAIKRKYNTLNFIQKCIVDELYSRVLNFDSTNIDFDHCDNICNKVNEIYPISLYDSLTYPSMIDMLERLPDIVGISITSTCQFIPGCKIAQLIKKINPKTKVVFGGSCADLFFNSKYKNKNDIYEFFDYILIGEGETSITNLIKYIRGEIDFSLIPNIMMEDKEKNMIVQDAYIENVLELPVPNYDDLDLSLYLSPELILPYQSSRGCHYGNCAFCDHDEKYRHNYRSKLMKKVVDEIIWLSNRYDCHYFQFVDEAIRPDCFSIMVNEMELNSNFQNIKWFYYSRVSMRYDKAMLDLAYQNGCRMVMLGIETFNQRLLKFIKKGINAEASKYCLKLFHDCKIKTYAWLMDNLPSETLEDAKMDLYEVKELIDYIDAFYIGTFMLVPNTDMYKKPHEYNITEINESDTTRFQSHYNGNVIDKEAMFRFHTEEFKKYQFECFFTSNRYTIFWNNNY